MKQLLILAILAMMLGCSKNPIIDLNSESTKIAWITLGNAKGWYISGHSNGVSSIPESGQYKCKRITLYKVDMIFTYKKVDGTSGLIKMADGESYIWKWKEL